MPTDEPGEAIQQQIRSLGLKREVDEITGGEHIRWEAPDIDPVVEEQFWTHVRDYERAPWITFSEMLAREGVLIRPPEDVPDGQIHEALWELIRGMARLSIFLDSTDHLSDRELYEHLVLESLQERAKDTPREAGAAWHTSPVGSGSEEDMLIYHRFYASEEMRNLWLEEFPDYDMPPRETPPYDRDRFLPQQESLHWDGLDDEGDGDAGE